jgi:hypothetical protein
MREHVLHYPSLDEGSGGLDDRPQKLRVVDERVFSVELVERT